MLEKAGERMRHLLLMKVPFTLKHDFLFSVQFFTKIHVNLIAEGGFGDDGLDGDILGGDEEGGGWDVGDEDLVLPPDLVSFCEKFFITKVFVNPGFNQFYT